MRWSRLFIRAYLARAAVLWLTMRLVVSAVLAFGGTNPLATPFVVSVALIGASTSLMLVDLRRRHERILIENLAITPSFVVAIAALPAAIGESALRILHSLIA